MAVMRRNVLCGIETVFVCWCLERLKAKGEWGRQKMRWLGNITDSMGMNLSKLWETVEDRGAWHATVQREAKSWIQLNNCITASHRILPCDHNFSRICCEYVCSLLTFYFAPSSQGRGGISYMGGHNGNQARHTHKGAQGQLVARGIQVGSRGDTAEFGGMT